MRATGIDVGGAVVPIMAFGPPSGPPTLLLPGLSDGLAPISRPEVADGLPPPPPPLAHRRVLVVSHRHPVTPDVTTEQLARDAAEVLERSVERPAAVVGHSMGAMVAMHLAAARPDLVDRVVLSAGVPSADADVCAVLDRWDAEVTEGRIGAFLRDAVDVSYIGAARIRRQVALRLGASPPDLADLAGRHLALSQAIRTHDARDRLGGISAPTLVLGGARDPLCRPARLEELAAGIARSRLQIWPRVAHGLPEQARRRYVGVLAAFLGRGPRRRPTSPLEQLLGGRR